MTDGSENHAEKDAERRRILSMVAAGTLDPGDAADRLAALDAPPPPGAPEGRPAGGTGGADDATRKSPADGGRATPANGVRQIKVIAAFSSVTVIGDSSVLEATADGEHNVRREGDTLIFETEPVGNEFAFAFAGPGRRSRIHKFAESEMWHRERRVRTVQVRVNPNLPLDAEVDAGSLTVEGVRGPIKARAAAGALRIIGFSGPIDLSAAAGSVTAEGRIDSGSSRIQCDAGKVALRLERGSSVAIATTVNLGKVAFLNAHEPVQSRGQNRATSESSYTVGAGAGTLDITVNLGSVTVDIDE